MNWTLRYKVTCDFRPFRYWLNMHNWKLQYKVTCDFRPYRYWLIEAESVDEARLVVARKLRVPLEQVDASIEAEKEAK
jgi:hypothetical protein